MCQSCALEKHVDARPRMAHSFVGREMKGLLAHKQMIASGGKVAAPLPNGVLVVGFGEIEGQATVEKTLERRSRIDRPMHHKHDRRQIVAGNMVADLLQGGKP